MLYCTEPEDTMGHDEDEDQFPRWLSITGKPLDLDLPHGLRGKCRSIHDYHHHERLGEGAYGVVYRSTDTRTSKVYALKHMRVRDRDRLNGMPITSIREIGLLKSLNHKNIISVRDVAVGEGYIDDHANDDDRGRRRDDDGEDDDADGENYDEEHEDWEIAKRGGRGGVGGGGRWRNKEVSDLGDVWMVMEYAEQDMGRLCDDLDVQFSLSEVKCLMKQLIEGVEYIHSQNVIHRDIKMSNLLYTHSGTLKLADFGMARPYDPTHRPLTPDVVTIWYRAPELLLGLTRYTKSIDLWSCGCILGELLLMSPLLPGTDELDQLIRISHFLGGPPTEEAWPRFHLLPGYTSQLLRDLSIPPSSDTSKEARELRTKRLDERFRGETKETMGLLRELLCWDPERRMSARRVLEHRWFWGEEPRPKEVERMPRFELSRRRREKRGRGRNKGKDRYPLRSPSPPSPPPPPPPPHHLRGRGGGGERDRPSERDRDRDRERGGGVNPPRRHDDLPPAYDEGGGTAAAVAANVVRRGQPSATTTLPGEFGSGAAGGFVFDFDFPIYGGGGKGGGGDEGGSNKAGVPTSKYKKTRY